MNNSSHYTSNATGTFVGLRGLVLGLLVLIASSVAFAGSRISSIVVFGDSLSDTGRLFRLTDGGFPPRVAYFHGRQSNGPVWVEYLADELHLEHRVRNYAAVGAMSGPSADIPSGNVWSDTFAGLEGTSLRGQLASYLGDTGGTVDPEALYIVEGGANDLIQPLAGLLMNPPATPEAFMAKVSEIATPVVINVATIAGTLKAMGAQHIAVVNVPDFGKAPLLVGYGPQASAIVSMLVAMINEAVGEQLDALESAGGSKLARIDAYGFIDRVAAAPADYGFTNVTGQFMFLDRSNGTVTYASAERRAVSEWLFWDHLHPTTRGHKLFAKSALAELRAAFPTVLAAHVDNR